jgi:hypothetical protein
VDRLGIFEGVVVVFLDKLRVNWQIILNLLGK